MKIAPIIAAMTTTSTIESRIVTSLNRLRIDRVRSDFGDNVSSGYGPFDAHPAIADAIAIMAAVKLTRWKLMLRGGFITRLQSIGHRDFHQLPQSGNCTVDKGAQETGRYA